MIGVADGNCGRDDLDAPVHRSQQLLRILAATMALSKQRQSFSGDYRIEVETRSGQAGKYVGLVCNINIGASRGCEMITTPSRKFTLPPFKALQKNVIYPSGIFLKLDVDKTRYPWQICVLIQ